MTDMKKLGLSALALAIVAGSMTGCSDDDDKSARATGSINASGGNGGLNGGYGGSGDYGIYVYKESGPGDIVVAAGSANAGFTPKSFTPFFGDNKLTISASTTVAVVAAEPAVGTPYLVAGDSTLYVSDGDAALADADDVVTGLQIGSGATVTFEPNMDWYNGDGIYETVYLSIDADVRHAGRITTANASNGFRSNFDLYCNNYLGGGSIDTSGEDDPADADSKTAGYIDVYADYALINSGRWTANGGDDTAAAGTGGYAGWIYAEGYYYTQNTGDMSSNGGAAPDGSAGDGNEVYLYSGYGAIMNSGDLSAAGGTGETGGSGGDIYIDNNTVGNVFNSGRLTATGADSTVGSGGWGGYVELYTYGGELRNSGAVRLGGGDTTDVTGSGGGGGDLYIYTDYGSQYEYTPNGGITWSGNIDTSGGNAVATTSGTGNGGDGGYFYIDAYSYGYPGDAPIRLLGYGSVNASGGDGDFGGSGGYVELYNDYTYDYATGNDVPGGSTLVRGLNIDISGGDALADGVSASADGGYGGDLYVETHYYNFPGFPAKAVFVGNIAGESGQNRETTSTDHSAYVWIWGYNGATYSGSADVDGGSDIGTDGGTTGYGSHADSFEVYAELGETRVSGSISNDGGDGEYSGGHSDGVYIYGAKTYVSANISSDGGNADPALNNSSGNDGGWIEIISNSGVGSITGALTAKGGTGFFPGDSGGIVRLISCSGNDC